METETKERELGTVLIVDDVVQLGRKAQSAAAP
jgi:hypothetical protein